MEVKGWGRAGQIYFYISVSLAVSYTTRPLTCRPFFSRPATFCYQSPSAHP